MTSTLEYIAGLLAFLVAFLVVGFWFDSFSPNQEVFVYPVVCEGQESIWQCHKSIHTLGRTGYKVYPEQQRVVYWDEEKNDGPLPLVACVVRDKDNWTCQYPDGSGTLKMIDGDFAISAESQITYIDSWRYWFIRLARKIGL